MLPLSPTTTMTPDEAIFIGGVSLEAFVAFILALFAFLVAGNLIYLSVRQGLEGRVSRSTAKWVSALLQYGVIIGGVYASARYLLAFNLTAFTASLGILGIVIAFSSTQIIQNVLAGVLITVNRPIQLEEWVVVGGWPTTGLCRVRDVSFTTTILQGLDGGLVLLPNSQIVSSKVINYSRAGLMEVLIPLSVPACADLGRVREIALQVAHDHPLILPHLGPAERSKVQDLFELPYLRRLSSDRPDLTIFEPKIQISSIKEEWIRLTVRVWIRKITRKDEIVSEYLGDVIRRLKNEHLLDEEDEKEDTETEKR
ncbi:mechanosensitive ion channel family protein [uncultured Methanofollis sp.]|uniref:mechanosensitive ion channel family protein n=1 Tax=uncultured Methanofollis sp. TaxID=262500 RepID=UPI00263021C9|nr:mechanosensitive ion channel domain-containing protein [uncultured Methanofollis sp.]